MSLALYFAACLIVALAIAHSYLGDRYILIRLARHGDLPKTLGSAEYTIRALRLVWHLVSVAWLVFAAILILLAHPPVAPSTLGLVIGCTFLGHFALVLAGSRGKHLSWPLFLAIGVIAIYATRV
jgi:hypothetical protein